MGKYKIYVDYLLLEVTRRCNMQCHHCLRGPSERINMSESLFDILDNQIKYVNGVTFTGGEPTLNVGLIEHVLNIFKEKEKCGAFWMTTNAKIYSRKLISIMNDFYENCNEPDCCGFSVSTDQFHDEVNPGNISKYKKLPFYTGDKELGQIKDKQIVNDGFAYENGIGYRNLKFKYNDIEIEIYGDRINVTSDLYINAKGDVLPHCDMSYENQEEFKMGNLYKESLEDILLRSSNITRRE